MSRRRRPWTPADLATLRYGYPHMPTAVLAEQLGRSAAQVYCAAYAQGLHKTPAYLASEAACRLRTDSTIGQATRIQPGSVPWNKGQTYNAGGRSVETQFKPGRPAHTARNYVPIGSLRICKDGYLERKYTDNPALKPTRRWVAVHRLVWQAAHGPIPAGHVVVFKPGQKTAQLELITAERLQCISRVENMRRNSVHTKLPPEVARLVQLRGQLQRAINRREQRPQEEPTHD